MLAVETKVTLLNLQICIRTNSLLVQTKFQKLKL